MTISEKIYKLRQDSKLSQKEFALKVGTSQSAINYWENGKRQPRIAQIKKIAEAFDLPLYILTDEKYELWDITDEVHKNRARFVGEAEMLAPPHFTAPATSSVKLDSTKNDPYNLLFQMIKASKEEQQILRDFPKDSIQNIINTIYDYEKYLKRLYTVCDELNETGQKKVLEHAEMLAEIPKYRKGTTEEQE